MRPESGRASREVFMGTDQGDLVGCSVLCERRRRKRRY